MEAIHVSPFTNTLIWPTRHESFIQESAVSLGYSPCRCESTWGTVSDVTHCALSMNLSFRILQAIAQSHPEKSGVFKSDLDKSLPRVLEVQAALVRLKQLCINGEL